MLYSALYSINNDCELSITIIMIKPPSYLEYELNNSLDRLNKRYSLRIVSADIKEIRKAKSFHGSLGPYLLFLSPHVVDSNRVIYLDSDIIVSCDLSELYSYNIENKIIAAVGTKGLNWVLKKEKDTLLSHGISIDSTYFNTGVVLFDSEKYIEKNIKERVFEFIRNCSSDLYTADQTVVNIVLSNKIFELPEIYNVGHRNIKYNPDRIFDNHGIFHYIGSPKPWDPFGYKINSKADQFFKILKDTGFKPPLRWRFSFMRLKRLAFLARSYYNKRV